MTLVNRIDLCMIDKRLYLTLSDVDITIWVLTIT